MNAPLEKTAWVKCSMHHAFNVFTARVDLWWPKSHRRNEGGRMVLEAKEGGRFLERSPEGEAAILGEVIHCDPPDRITYTWYPGSDIGPTEVDVRFLAENGGTRVNITHVEGKSQLGTEWPNRVKRFDRAWTTVLPAFLEAAEAGE